MWRKFANHDLPNASVTLGIPPHEVNISGLEYAGDAGLFDINAQNASERVLSISIGSMREASMIISIPIPKTKAIHIHRKVKISNNTENDIAALHLKYKNPACNRDFPTSLNVHQTRWYDGGRTIRSRKGSLADKAAQRVKRIETEKQLEHVMIEGHQNENVYSFEYMDIIYGYI